MVSVRDFSQVSQSVVISFTAAGKLLKEASAIPGTVHVEVSAGFFGRAFAWAPERNRRAALEALDGADLIVCHILLRYHLHWVSAVARERNIPYWVVPHGSLDPYVFSYRSLQKKVWFYLCGRQFLKKAACVVFATRKEQAKAGRYYSGENRRVIHWPVSALPIERRDQARELIRRKHGIAADDRILISLGRLHPSKRPLETITAFAQAGVPGAHLLMVGPEEAISTQGCRDLIGKLRVKNVHLTGPVYGDEKNDYLLASDAYISLSHKENFGYTTAEALAAGLPVILSPGNDLADELVSLQCGWMLADDLPQSAVSAIREFGSLPLDRLQAMGLRGRSWALANLGFDRFSEQVHEAAAASLRNQGTQ